MNYKKELEVVLDVFNHVNLGFELNLDDLLSRLIVY